MVTRLGVRVRVFGRGGANRSAGGGAWISFLICDHLASPGSCWLPPPALPQCPMGFYREVTTAAKHTRSPNAYSTRARARSLAARKQRNNIKTLWSGGAPDSTRQRKGGWRDGFPLCVAMATTVDGERLVSCTAVELGEIHLISFKYFSFNVSLITCQHSALPVSISCADK